MSIELRVTLALFGRLVFSHIQLHGVGAFGRRCSFEHLLAIGRIRLKPFIMLVRLSKRRVCISLLCVQHSTFVGWRCCYPQFSWFEVPEREHCFLSSYRNEDITEALCIR